MARVLIKWNFLSIWPWFSTAPPKAVCTKIISYNAGGKNMATIQDFHFTKGAALKLHSAKAGAELLFDAQLGPYTSFTPHKRVQSKVLYSRQPLALQMQYYEARQHCLKLKWAHGLIAYHAAGISFPPVWVLSLLRTTTIHMGQDNFAKQSTSRLSKEVLLMMGYMSVHTIHWTM